MKQVDSDNTQVRKSSMRVMGMVKTASGHSSKCSSSHTQDSIHRSADIPSKNHNLSEGRKNDAAATVNRPRDLGKYLIISEDPISDKHPGRCSWSRSINTSSGGHSIVIQLYDQEQPRGSEEGALDQFLGSELCEFEVLLPILNLSQFCRYPVHHNPAPSLLLL